MSGFLSNPAGSAPMTGAAIKAAYESQPDTNPLSDDRLQKLQKSIAVSEHADDRFPLFIGGAMRNGGDQSDAYSFFELIDDATHKPIGFRNALGAGLEIETFDDKLRVHHNIGADYVGAVVANLDETLAQTGLRLGTTVGTDFTDIWLYRDFMAGIYRSGVGVWQHDPNNAEPFSATWKAAGYLEVTFPDTPSAHGIVSQTGSVGLGDWSAQFEQVSATSGRVRFFRNKPIRHTGRIRWNSGFSLIGTSENMTIGTFAGGALPINFTNGDVDAFDIRAVAGSGINGIGYRIQVKNPGSGGCEIQWIDKDDNIVTTPDDRMDVIVSARSRVLAEQPPASTSFILRVLSRGSINPKSVTQAAYPSGNLWVIGFLLKAFA